MKNSIRFKILLFMFLFLFSGDQIFLEKHLTAESKSHQTHSQIILTEVMFDPLGSEYYDEFVEIYNLSSSDSVDLSGWQIGDGEGFDQIIDADRGLKLAPGQFGLILDSGYFDNSTSYDSLIPPEALVLTIDGASFGQRGWSNSSAKEVIFLDSSGINVEHYLYSIGNLAGFSDEKIILSNDNSQQNWKDSYQLLGTPGSYNSVSPKQNDLALELVSAPFEHPEVNKIWQITLRIKNIGADPAEHFQVQGYFYFDQFDSSLIYNQVFSEILNPDEEIIQAIFLQADNPGLKNYRFILHWSKDENYSNNIVSYSEKIPFEPGSVVINEIMYYPQSNAYEWLEIYNNSHHDLYLQNWKISTENQFDGAETISTKKVNLEKGQYLVLSGDAIICEMNGEPWIYVNNFPRLTDYSENVFLFDPFGTLVDSVTYLSTWGKRRGFSLERIWYEKSGLDSSNWKLSQNLAGTPGTFNSRSPLETDIFLSSFFANRNPVPYSFDTELSVMVKNIGRTEIEQVELQLFFDFNLDSLPQTEELIFPIQPLEIALGAEDSTVFDFQLSNLNSGFLHLSAIVSMENDQNVTNNFKSFLLKVGYPLNSIIINEIMYYPYPNEPEWIEIFNRSNLEVNLMNWELGETSTKKYYPITSEDVIINPNSYVVVSADSSIETWVTSKFLVPAKFPLLNNDAENITLIDFAATLIDSVFYYSTWGGEIGISLERINPNLCSNVSSNWASSASPLGKTPGEQNSIFAENVPSNATISVHPNPFSPDGDGHEDFTMIQYDLPMTTAYVSIKIFDLLGRQVCDLLNTTPSGSHRDIIWNGKKNNGENLRIGVYIIYLEALSAKKGLLKQVKKPVVIAGKL